MIPELSEINSGFVNCYSKLSNKNRVSASSIYEFCNNRQACNARSYMHSCPFSSTSCMHHCRNPVLCRVPAALPSTFYRALGKVDFTESHTRQSPALDKELVYRVQDTRHSEALGKDCFAERQTLGKDGSRQRAINGRSKADDSHLLPRVEVGTREKSVFTECLLWTLGKVYFYFFYFGHQTFCGMFLHYVDLHVPFWDNYNSVFNS
jgi:hypothetical protein